MDAMRCRSLDSFQTGRVDIEEWWEAEVYAPLLCSECHRIRPEHQHIPLDVHLELDTCQLNWPVVYARYRYCTASLVRADVLEVLRPHMEYFWIGRVFHAGTAVTNFANVFGTRKAQVPRYGGAGSKHPSCPECGHPFHVLTPPEYMLREETLGKHVFSDITGLSLYVLDDVFAALPAKTQREFRSRNVFVELR